MGYSLKQCKTDMRQMWKWLSENPTKDKYNFIKVHPDCPDLNSDCAACEYDSHKTDDCLSCPINWSAEDCYSITTSFSKWSNSLKPRTRSIYAKEVYKLALQIKVK